MERKKHYFFILILILFGQFCYGQTSRKDSLLKELRNAPRLEINHLNSNGNYSEVYETAQLLIDICPIDTLLKLTSDSSPIVRCYMYYGLIEKHADEKIIKDVYDKHKNDSAKVGTILNDNGLVGDVRGYMEHLYSYSEYKDVHTIFKPDTIHVKEIYTPYLLPGVSYTDFKSHFKFKGDIITKEALLKMDSLISPINTTIVSFTLVALKDTASYEEKSTRNIITAEMKKAIKDLETGNKVFFEEIRAIKSDGSLVKLMGLIIKIE